MQAPFDPLPFDPLVRNPHLLTDRRQFLAAPANLRSCGGTEHLCDTMYHSGLTEDTHWLLKRLSERFPGPLFVIGFSLGGNVALKLLSELDGDVPVAGGCSVSAPVDLAACVDALNRPSNTLYARRFLSRLKARVRRKSANGTASLSSKATRRRSNHSRV